MAPDTVLQQSGDATRLLLKGLVMAAKRTLDGPEGWFPRPEKGFEQVSEFRASAKTSRLPLRDP